MSEPVIATLGQLIAETKKNGTLPTKFGGKDFFTFVISDAREQILRKALLRIERECEGGKIGSIARAAITECDLTRQSIHLSPSSMDDYERAKAASPRKGG